MEIKLALEGCRVGNQYLRKEAIASCFWCSWCWLEHWLLYFPVIMNCKKNLVLEIEFNPFVFVFH